MKLIKLKASLLIIILTITVTNSFAGEFALYGKKTQTTKEASSFPAAGIYSKTTTDDSYGLFSRSSLRNADPGGRPDNGDGIGQEGGSPVVTPAGDGLLVILLGILIYGIARYRSTLRKIIS